MIGLHFVFTTEVISVLRLLQVLLKESILLLVLEANFEQSMESTFETKFKSLKSWIGVIPGIMPVFWEIMSLKCLIWHK